MKNILVLILFVLLAQTRLFAQGADTLTKICTYDEFPVGAMRYPNASMLEGMLGMNFNWMGFPPPGTDTTFPIQQRPVNYTGASIRDPFYYDDGVTHNTTDHQFLLASAAYAIDIRVYLSNTSGKIKDYTSSWNSNIGYNRGDRPYETYFRGDTALYGSYILSNLSNRAMNEPYTGVGIHQPELTPYTPNADYLNKDHINTYSYETVFFFDPADLGTVGLDDSLYLIEYWIKKSSDAGFVRVDSVLITKRMYNALPLARTQVDSRNVDAENLDVWDGQSTKRYSIQKKTLNIRSYFEGTNLEKAPQVDVRLKTFKKIPIYVRMLRIRDWVAQKLLTGQADSTLNIVISNLKSYSINRSIKSWTIGNEPQFKNFHGYGYVNDLLVKK